MILKIGVMTEDLMGIQGLLDLLYGWSPYSATFRKCLIGILSAQHTQAREVLCARGTQVRAAWYSVDAWVLLWRPMENGEGEVARIYGPGEILTEPGGFFGGGPAQGELSVIQGSRLLRISRTDFAQLKKFAETFDLAQGYMLAEREMETWRLGLLALHEGERLAAFALRYPLSSLPAVACASFLRMTPSRFSAARASYLRTHR